MTGGWLAFGVMTSLILVFPGRVRAAETGKTIPEANTPSQGGPFDAWIEQAAKNPPSEELPVDQSVAAQVKTAGSRICQAAMQGLKGTPYKSADVRIRSIYYVLDEGAPHIQVDYDAKADTRDSRSEFISCGIRMEIRNGRLVQCADSWRQISPFADTLTPILRAAGDSVLKALTYPEPLSSVKWEEAGEVMTDHLNRLLNLYLRHLTNFLESHDAITGVKDRVNPASRIGFKTSHFEEQTVCRRDSWKSVGFRFSGGSTWQTNSRWLWCMRY
jgi:hypothetical protein